MKKVISILTSLVLALGFCFYFPDLSAEAATKNDIDQSDVFLKQAESDTCTLCAATMLIRRVAIMAGRSDWRNITESAVKQVAWFSNGLYYNFTYSGITIGHSGANSLGGLSSTNKTEVLKNVLEEHPEGIVAYDRQHPHAILLTDYTDGIFYCADPAGRSVGRTPISNAIISFDSIDEYWYCKSPDVSLDPLIDPADIGHEMSESEAAGRTLPDGDYWIFNGLGTDYYLDVPGDAISGGGGLEMWHCGSSMPNIYDVWTVTYLNNGFYSILQKNSAAGLDVCNAEMTRGTHVQLCNYNGNYAQQWSISKTGNGYQIRSRRNNFYLDVIGGSTEAGTGLWTYSQNDTPAQQFCFIPYSPDEQPLTDGTYSIRTAVDTNYCMESDGTNAQVWQNAGEKVNSVWSNWSDWSDTTVSASDSREVETRIDTRSRKTGYNMVTYTTQDANSPYYRWFREFSINGQYSAYGNRSSYGEHTSRRTATVDEINNSRVIAPGGYFNGNNNGYIKGNANAYVIPGDNGLPWFIESEIWENYNVTQYRYRDRTGVPTTEYCKDTFDIQYRGDGWYSILDHETKLSLSVDRSNNEFYLNNGLNDVFREYNGARSQLWKIRKVSDNRYVLFSALNGYTVDLQGAVASNGANIFSYPHHGNDNQIWSFVSIPLTGTPDVSVFPGTASSETDFLWTAENATKYTLKIFSEQGGEMKSFRDVSDLTETEYSAVLPAGNYEFYVEAYNEYSQKASERVSFTVFDNPLSDEGITLSQTVFPYTGSAVKVGSYLSVKYNGKKLQYGTDFTTTYKNCVNAGYQTASVTVTGIGNYTGTVTKYYTITPAQQAAPVLTPVEGGFQAAWTKDTAAVGYQLQYCKNSSFTGDTLHSAVYTGTSAALTKYPADGETWYVRVRAFVSSDGTTAGTKYGIWSDAASCTVPLTLTDADVTLSKTSLPYTGSAVKVGSYLTVRHNGKKLVYGTDFTTTYKNCVKAGYQTASVTVTGVGNYTGTVTKYYTITPAQQAAPVLTPVAGGFQAAWTKDSNAVGYQLQYCKNSSFTGDTLHSAVYTGTSAALTKYPADGETWYVRVRAFVSSDGTTAGTKYGVWSDAASCTVPLTLTDADVRLSKTVLPYTGSAVKVGSWLSVKYNGKKLVYGTDFTTTYKNCVKAGYQTASVTVTGIGKYTGTVTKYYTIAPAQQAAPQLSFDDNGLHVQWTADSRAVGYQVMYCQDESFASSDPSYHVAVYGAGKTSCDLTKYPKYGETWFVRVRAFVSSDGTTAGTRSGIWSETAAIRAIDTLEITKLPNTDDFYEYFYEPDWYDFACGEYEAIDVGWGTPAKIGNYIKVRSGGKKLVYGTDFTISYRNNVLNDGEWDKIATVTVRGTGEYYGTVSGQFLVFASP